MKIISYLCNMLFKRSIIFAITCIILFADSGQMVYAHTCFKLNHTYFSLYAPDECCAEERVHKSCCNKEEVQERAKCNVGKSDCCSVSAKYFKQSFPTTEPKLLKETVLETPTTGITFFRIYISDSFARIFQISSPPLLYSKADIHLTQVFRI